MAYSGSVVAARQAATIAAAVSAASSTFGHERFSSIVTSSSCAQVSAYSCAENPPTDTHSGTPSSRSWGSVSATNASRPGLARPIELSMPTSVSAMRTGALPSRGSGVTVFVTNASSERATSGAVNASRQPLALRSLIAFDGSRSEGRANDHLDDRVTAAPIVERAHAFQNEDRAPSLGSTENAMPRKQRTRGIAVTRATGEPTPMPDLVLSLRRSVPVSAA